MICCNYRGQVLVEPEALTSLAQLCDGDARSALNALQIAVQAKQPNTSSVQLAVVTPSVSNTQEQGSSSTAVVTVQDAMECICRTHLLYDNAGEEHYNCISALHKSMRGSHESASLYWLARMLCAGEDPLYVARRIVRFASEDIGNFHVTF